jgi:hypothetical protein
MKNSDYLFCHNLHRFTPIRQRQEIVLPCGLNQAMAVLGLSLEVKQITQPQLSAFPYRVLATDFRVARLTTRQVAAGSIPDYLNLSANRILRQLEWWLYQWQLFRPLQKLERAIPEVVIELFHVPIYRSVELAPRDPANPLAVAHFHFSDCDHHKPYLRLWQGWDDDSTSRCQTKMAALLQNYLFLIDHLFSAEPTIPGSFPDQKKPPLIQPPLQLA